MVTVLMRITGVKRVVCGHRMAPTRKALTQPSTVIAKDLLIY